MGWTCNICTLLNPEIYLQCPCGTPRQRTDIAAAASVARAVTENPVHAAVVRNAIAAALAATDLGDNTAVARHHHGNVDNDYENEDEDEDNNNGGGDDDGDDEEETGVVVNDDDDDDDDVFPALALDHEDDDGGDDDDDDEDETGVDDDDDDDDDDDIDDLLRAFAPGEEEEEETESLVMIPAHFFDTKSGRVLADTQGDIAVINNAYDSRARLVNENTVGGTSPVGVGVRMEHLKDYHCDPVTREPPSQGVEFLILDANGQPNRQVFELSQLIEYFRVNISTAEGQWQTKVRHPNQDIWCDQDKFLDFIKPVSKVVQTYLTNCRIRSGLNAVDHPLSLNQMKFIARCRQRGG